jgi:hypothetical protein
MVPLNNYERTRDIPNSAATGFQIYAYPQHTSTWCIKLWNLFTSEMDYK